MGIVEVPGVGTVVVRLVRHEFGMTRETVTMLADVHWLDGQLASCVTHEKTAGYLEQIGVLPSN